MLRLYRSTGKIVIPTEIVQSEEECGNFVGGFAICSDYDHTKSYFIGKKRKVISKKYDAVGEFSEGIAMVANHNADGVFEEYRRDVLPLRVKAFKELGNEVGFCADMKALDEKFNCDKEWTK